MASAKPKQNSALDYKTAKAAPTATLAVLAKIVDFLGKRHLEQTTFALTLDEILTELQIIDMTHASKLWLQTVRENVRLLVTVPLFAGPVEQFGSHQRCVGKIRLQATLSY